MRLFLIEVGSVQELTQIIRELSANPLGVTSGATSGVQPQPEGGPGSEAIRYLWSHTDRGNVYAQQKPDLDVWSAPASGLGNDVPFTVDGEGPPLPSSGDQEPTPPPPAPVSRFERTTPQHPYYQDGINAWYGLLHTWATNFGVEGAPQPDRAKQLMDMLNFGGPAPWVYIRAFSGLTEAVYALVGKQWGKKKTRMITENIVQVASALAYRELADHLEYTGPYVRWAMAEGEEEVERA